MKDSKLTLSKASHFLNIHPKTLQKMDRDGRLKAFRTKTNRRYYLKSQLQKIKDKIDKERDVKFLYNILKLVKKYYY